ncbi:hypothetical protein GBA52_004954 [Prunus armeniaca]|nr:hypothetical protein GBA52_004954 [Prunus armeniaca]
MPTLNLFTNLPVDAVVASDILKDATKAVSKIIGKPESYVMILLNGSVPMAFAGTEEPAAYGELISIGGIGPSVNGKLSSTIAEILETKLSIDSSRFYIKFYDVEKGHGHFGLKCGSSLGANPPCALTGCGDAISVKVHSQHFSKKLGLSQSHQAARRTDSKKLLPNNSFYSSLLS